MFRDNVSDFEQVALPHMNCVFRAAYALCGREQVAEDLVQTTFLKSLEKFESFKPGSNCKAWLLSILRHTWIDELRKKKFSAHQLGQSDELVEAHEPQAELPNANNPLEAFSDQAVIRALGQLPEEQRLTLYLVDVEEMSYQEVAQIMAVPLGTVKSRSSHARAALREKLDAYARNMGFAGRL